MSRGEFCLDSWAVLAWLNDVSPAAARVDALIRTRPVISWINLAEVHYRVARDHGFSEADQVLAHLERLVRPDEPSPELIIQAARIKAVHPIALGDCFAIATAMAHDATLLTGDPEIIDADGLHCRVEDLRTAPRA